MPNLFTRIDQPDGKWFRGKVHEFYLPTEVVVAEPKIVTPRVGRYYDIDLYLRWGKELLFNDRKLPDIGSPGGWDLAVLVPYDTLRHLSDFEGTAHETQIYLYEVWSDFGSDGHVEYEFVYWMLYPGVCDQPTELYNTIRTE